MPYDEDTALKLEVRFLMCIVGSHCTHGKKKLVPQSYFPHPFACLGDQDGKAFVYTLVILLYDAHFLVRGRGHLCKYAASGEQINYID